MPRGLCRSVYVWCTLLQASSGKTQLLCIVYALRKPPNRAVSFFVLSRCLSWVRACPLPCLWSAPVLSFGWHMLLVHACTMTVVHACTMLIVHARAMIMIIVHYHSAWLYFVHDICMDFEHSTYMYYDHSACLHCDHSTCTYYDHSTCVHCGDDSRIIPAGLMFFLTLKRRRLGGRSPQGDHRSPQPFGEPSYPVVGCWGVS